MSTMNDRRTGGLHLPTQPPSLLPFGHPFRFRLASACLLCTVTLLLLVFACQPTEEPALESVAPSTALSGKATAITINGQGFADGTYTARLVGREHSVVLQDVTRVDAFSLKATVPVDAPSGPYDLEVTFPGEKKVKLGGAFELLSNALQIVFIDVGQGDATLLISPSGKTMLIDSGRPGMADRIRDVLTQRKIRALDHVLMTHYDADHVGSLEDLLNGPDGKTGTSDDILIKEALWDRGGESKSFTYRRARERFKSIHKPLDGLSDASFPTIDLGDGVSVEVKATNGVLRTASGKREQVNCGTDENCRSLGTMIKVGAFRMWTAGDLTGGGNGTPDMETLLAKHVGRVDIYRAHHHGSKTSSNDALLAALKPQLVIVSAGKDNSYCHPHASILSRFMAISGVWIVMTTEGILSTEDVKKCGKSTGDRLQTIGTRGILSAGSFVVQADQSGFSLPGVSADTPSRWTAKGK
jgi:beta-lactamase superfamily II metal-dependent hydrolase